MLVVDDNPDVLRTIEDDLRLRYGAQYQMKAVRTGAAARDLLETAGGSVDGYPGGAVALVLADQRMGRMSGRAVLAAARALVPGAKRVLLVLPEDTAVALEAITTGEAHDFLVKPWTQPAERIFPLLDDLLEDWHGQARAGGAALQVVGSRWSPAAYRVREFLGRNLVPYRWLDVETPAGGRLAERLAPGETHQVLVRLPDGTALAEPTMAALAEQVGLPTQATHDFFDLVIVGAGPAGLAAAVYGASEGLRTAMVEAEAPGGQAGGSARIENYLGFPAGLSGGDLTRRAVAQARRFGAELLTSRVATGVYCQDGYRVLTLADGGELRTRALLIATGVTYRTLDVPGSAHLNGAGIYYGSAMTEAFSCRDEDVYIVGGANSAGQAAVYLAGFAGRVTLLVRRSGLSTSMSRYLIDQLGKLPNVVIRPRTEVVAVHGANHLEAITVRTGAEGQTETLPAAALFVFIGAAPQTEWLPESVARDAQGFLLTGPDLPPRAPGEREPYLLETSVPGIFAAGDVRHGSMKRVASGVGEGAMAVAFVHQYLAVQ